MYLSPLVCSHSARRFSCLKASRVICSTERGPGLVSIENVGVNEVSIKCCFWKGTKFVWNSLMSMLNSLLRRSEMVSDEITCAIILLRLP